jgi:hypothetical protein
MSAPGRAVVALSVARVAGSTVLLWLCGAPLWALVGWVMMSVRVRIGRGAARSIAGRHALRRGGR